MGKQTPSQAKNTIRRSLFELVSPSPTDVEKEEIWRYFKEECAYCGRKISKDERKGHLDHIIAISRGGTNSKYNHLLACSICNGDEKREMEWDQFLQKKAADNDEYLRRKRIIEEWKARDDFNIHEGLLKLVNQTINIALQNYDESVRYIRELKSND